MRNMYSAWARVLGAEYDELRKAAEAGKKTVLDDLRGHRARRVLRRGDRGVLREAGPAEEEAPELYEELKMYYGQDPEHDLTIEVRRKCEAIWNRKWLRVTVDPQIGMGWEDTRTRNSPIADLP